MQKTEDQLRSKEYNVKTTELFALQDNNHSKITNSTEKLQPDESPGSMPSTSITGEDQHENIQNNGRRTRKAALRARDKIKKLATNSVLNLKSSCQSPPLHAWHWETYIQMIDTDDLISIKTKCTTKPNPPDLDVEFPT